MPTQVGICNQALVFLGEKTIISLDDNTRQGELCSTFFDDTRDTLLRSHPWNFALKRMALTLLTGTPYGDEWDKQFLLPADCLRVLQTYPLNADYVIEHTEGGRRLLTNESEIGINFIFRNTDYGSYSPEFAQLLAARLAVLLAHTVTDKSGLVNQAMQWYQLSERMAKGIESQEGSPVIVNSNDLRDARYGSFTDRFVKDTLS